MKIKSILEKKLIENQQYITSVPEEYLDKLTNAIITDTAAGKSLDEIMKDIDKVYSMSSNRAKLIARTETGKLNAALTEARSRSLGLSQFVWMSALRDDTRESHAALHETICDYDNPPHVEQPDEDALPGETPDCYCWANPVVFKESENPTIDDENLIDDESSRDENGNIDSTTQDQIDEEAE